MSVYPKHHLHLITSYGAKGVVEVTRNEILRAIRGPKVTNTAATTEAKRYEKDMVSPCFKWKIMKA